MSTSAVLNHGDRNDDEDSDDLIISPALKFVVSNLKTMVPSSLAVDNYPTWRAQILKIFTTNRFDKYLDLSFRTLSETLNPTTLLRLLS